MFSKFQLMFANFYKIPITNVKKFLLNFFNKERHVLHYEKVQLYLRIGLKLKKPHLVLEFNQSQWLKPYVEFNMQKRIEAEKLVTKMEKRCTN